MIRNGLTMSDVMDNFCRKRGRTVTDLRARATIFKNK